MPALEAASDEHINRLINLKQKDMIVLLNDVKDSLKPMQADIMTLKADMTEVKASIGTLSNHQDIQVSFSLAILKHLW